MQDLTPMFPELENLMIEFYMSMVGVVLTVIAVLVAAWLGWRFSRGMSARPAYRIGITSFVALTVVVAMTWDVVRTSISMAQLCPQAGIHVKKAVKVDGFYINSGHPDMLKEGFQYIESQELGDRISVYRKSVDGVVKDGFDSRVYRLKSRYEVKYDVGEKQLGGRSDIGVRKSFVRDMQTNEELAYAIRFYAYPGWVDRHTLSLITQVFWVCPSLFQDHSIEMRKKTLLPLTTGK